MVLQVTLKNLPLILFAHTHSSEKHASETSNVRYVHSNQSLACLMSQLCQLTKHVHAVSTSLWQIRHTMCGKPCCIHMPGKMTKLYPATKAILTPQSLKMTCTVEQILSYQHTWQNPTGGGKETFLSITDIPLSTEMMVLEWPKRRWRDHTNLAAGASITSTCKAWDMDRTSVHMLQLQNHPVDFEDVWQWAIQYGLEGPGDWIPMQGEIYRTHPDRQWANPASCTMGTGSLSQG